MFVAGILGQGNNFKALAKRFVKTNPDWRALLVDLRAHGANAHFTHGEDTIEGAAADLARIEQSVDVPINMVIGHSFGGKVVTQYACTAMASREHTGLIVLDSALGRRLPEMTQAVVEDLHRMQTQGNMFFSTRAEFTDIFMGMGHDNNVAQWLALNLVPNEQKGKLHFHLDINRIQTLLDDYFTLDQWPLLDPPRKNLSINLVIAGKSRIYSEESIAHVDALATKYKEQVEVTTIPNVGHWLHAEAPGEMCTIFNAMKEKIS